MPTVWRYNGFRFFFYSMEGGEPPHIHVVKGNAEGKIWLEPQVKASYLHGFTNAEEKIILSVLKEQEVYFKQKWHEYFNK